MERVVPRNDACDDAEWLIAHFGDLVRKEQICRAKLVLKPLLPVRDCPRQLGEGREQLAERRVYRCGWPRGRVHQRGLPDALSLLGASLLRSLWSLSLAWCPKSIHPDAKLKSRLTCLSRVPPRDTHDGLLISDDPLEQAPEDLSPLRPARLAPRALSLLGSGDAVRDFGARERRVKGKEIPRRGIVGGDVAL